ncbi:MAG: trigger factor [Candidatus Delongbacteria bacterium]|jgi:trigger factor|nr:trigger factor [Candidatus Delongbacteria bacterium]
MKTESKIENGYKKTVSFEIDGTELDKYRKTSFEKFRKTAKIDGFRPGKVPESMLRTKFATGIEAEAVNEAVNSSYREYLIENNIYPLSEPVIDNIDKKDDSLTFTAVLEIFPEFELKKYSDLTVEQNITKLTDKEVEDSLNHLLDTYSSEKETDEPVKKGHVVNISIRSSGSDWQKQTVEIGKNENEKIDEQFIGMTKGESKTVKVDEKPEHDIEVRIDKVSEKILPELNDEFVKRYDPAIEGVEGLRKNVRNRLEKNRELNESREIFDKLAKKIVDEHDNFDVPPTILNRYIDDLVENARKQYGKGIDREMMKNIYGQNAEVSLKWEYIRHKIVENENITVSDEDVKIRLEEIAKENSVDIEKVEKYYSPKEKKQMLKDDLLDKKMRDILLAKNKVSFVEPSKEQKEAENK